VASLVSMVVRGLLIQALPGSLGRDQAPSAEPVRAGRVGGAQDLLAAGRRMDQVNAHRVLGVC
jgi:hypothetical protein